MNLERRPRAELEAIKKALSLHPWLNTPEDNARLAKVKELLNAPRRR